MSYEEKEEELRSRLFAIKEKFISEANSLSREELDSLRAQEKEIRHEYFRLKRTRLEESEKEGRMKK